MKIIRIDGDTMKKLLKPEVISSRPRDEQSEQINQTGEIDLHNPLVADSIQELRGYVKSMDKDLEKLERWEKEGKIRAECGCDSPSFMFVHVLDASILTEIKKINLVCFHENAEEEVS